MIGQISRLQAAIKYQLNDIIGCKEITDHFSQDQPETLIDQASILFKEGKIDEALESYLTAYKVTGFDAELCYYIALCYYIQRQFIPALKYIADIIENGIREYPELNVGMATEGVDIRSVGNTQTLHDSFLIEAFNLKAAIEFNLKNCTASSFD